MAKGRFTAQAEALRLYRRIATMDASAPLPGSGIRRRPGRKPPRSRGMGATRLADRLAELARTP